jgi:hypothetical protein
MNMFTVDSAPKAFGRDDLCRAVSGADAAGLNAYDDPPVLDIPAEDLYDAACLFSADERYSRTQGSFGRSPAAVADAAAYWDPAYQDVEAAYRDRDGDGVRAAVGDLVLSAIWA